MNRFIVNLFLTSELSSAAEYLGHDSADVFALHQSLPVYTPTPLRALPHLARRLGVGSILVKDESHRFGLKAFKALGSTYAIYRFIKEYLESHGGDCPPPEKFYRDHDFIVPNTFTFCTATDGNHGRGVAWVARLLKQKSVIYMPRNSAQPRIDNIMREGAEVLVADGDYDWAVAQCRRDAEKFGWQIVSDTSWPGYEQIPRWISAGYLTMYEEIRRQSNVIPDIIFVQVGVGALAASVAWYYRQINSVDRVKLVSVEPWQPACLLESIERGEPVVARADYGTIMAGLNCATPSPVAWPVIKDGFDLFMSISDDYAREAMRILYHPDGNDTRIVSGESGAAGLAALLGILKDKDLKGARDHLALNSKSAVLILNTEGDTDPDSFARIVKDRPVL